MGKYLTAKELDISKTERKALIAFVENDFRGQVIKLNGVKHYYDQEYVSNVHGAPKECGTSGCVVGYVFYHATMIQKQKNLNGSRSPNEYIDLAVDKNIMLHDLYSMGENHKLKGTRKVVKHMLQTGKVDWDKAGEPLPEDCTPL